MNFSKGKSYKLVELKGALVITDSDKNVTDGNPLIIADAGTLLTYLDRYFFERELGKELRVAHDLAMKTAGITKVRPPVMPPMSPWPFPKKSG